MLISDTFYLLFSFQAFLSLVKLRFRIILHKQLKLKEFWLQCYTQIVSHVFPEESFLHFSETYGDI